MWRYVLLSYWPCFCFRWLKRDNCWPLCGRKPAGCDFCYHHHEYDCKPVIRRSFSFVGAQKSADRQRGETRKLFPIASQTKIREEGPPQRRLKAINLKVSLGHLFHMKVSFQSHVTLNTYPYKIFVSSLRFDEEAKNISEKNYFYASLRGFPKLTCLSQMNTCSVYFKLMLLYPVFFNSCRPVHHVRVYSERVFNLFNSWKPCMHLFCIAELFKPQINACEAYCNFLFRWAVYVFEAWPSID